MNRNITIAEKYDPAMQITDQSAADAYFEECVLHNLELRKLRGEALDRADAERIERANIGYYAGYYDHATRDRVERLFKCAHPVFGAIAEKGPPTAREAFEAGVKLARRQNE